MPASFSEEDTRRFYDSEDGHYRSFWDQAGSLHWGVFDESTGDDFLKACANLNEIMARSARLDGSSEVVDLGCGNGNTSVWLARTTGCRVVGVDLSGVRVQNATDSLAREDRSLRERVRFERASITELPFADETFSHVWSQASIYHVPDKEKALAEACRVLVRGGTFVFDDLIKPKPDVSALAREFVYDRLLFDTDFSFDGYGQALAEAGFEVREAEDLSGHLETSYTRLAELAEKAAAEQGDEHFRKLSFAYRQMVRCIRNQEVGWARYVCRKPTGDRSA